MLKVFQSFRGAWAFERKVFERSALFGSVRGEARFKEQNPHTFLYREDGEYTLVSGPSMRAFREYLYLLQENNISVYHRGHSSDLFMELRQHEQMLQGRHLCNKDDYRAEYTFHGPGEFQVVYHIQGPQKDQRIETVFRRLHGSSE